VQEKNAGRLDPLLITVGVLLLYAAFPSYLHLFDGVACAIAVELGDFKHLVHGNHLLYGIVGYAFHRLLFLAGLKLPALWTLQVLDSLLGAAAAGLGRDQDVVRADRGASFLQVRTYVRRLGGIVRDPALHEEVCATIAAWLAAQPGWRVSGVTDSPIEGAEGNKGFLVAAVLSP